MKTVGELYTEIQQQLQAGGCDSPAFDACCLLEDIGGIRRGAVPQSQNTALTDEQCHRLREATARRANGEPLQYLLGTWDFLSLTLYVGDGVLIPRPETELLCEIAASFLQPLSQSTVLDLCAGSGCVGLGVASLCPTSTVYALEKSPAALVYLRKNIQRYPSLCVKACEADVLLDEIRFPSEVDAILANPPYIPSQDLSSLQREVQYEPSMALDGGEDGLRFYRAIAEQWVPHLRPGGLLAVEIGIGQAEAVTALFADAGVQHIHTITDFAGVPRVIHGIYA